MNTDEVFQRFRAKSSRIIGYDYSQPGAYFITIATHNRAKIFGNIHADKPILNEKGEIALRCWNEIPEHCQYASLDEFIIMPDHLHGILWIEESNAGRDTACRVSTVESFSAPTVGSIPTIVRSFKSAVTKQIHKLEPHLRIWQSNYYEHIVRNDKDLEKIRIYIKYNAYDRFDF